MSKRGLKTSKTEAPLRCEVPRDGRQELRLIVDRGEMLDDAEGRDDQGERLGEGEVPHVVLREIDARLHRGRLGREVNAATLEHLRRAIDPRDRATGTRDGQQNPTGATAYLQHSAARRFRFVYVEADIGAGRVKRHAVIEETEIGNRVVRRSH